MNILLCGFGNPDNRGCEAIIRTVSKMTKEAFPDAHIAAMSNDYGKVPMPELDTVERYVKSYYPHPGKLGTYMYYGSYRLLGGAGAWCELNNWRAYRTIGKPDICISVGGDNFCYNDRIDCFLAPHRHYKRAGAKLIHWGSSFEDSLMSPTLVADLNSFDLIMVRESLSYNTLKKAKVKAAVSLIPDPAFTMEMQETEFSSRLSGDLIGINVSSMVMAKEHYQGAVKENVINLINYITDNSKSKILLIPHVCNSQTGDGDHSVMKNLLKYVKNPERCTLVGYQYNAMQLKSIIAKCRLFIGARTHATIAAYSTGVPTMVIGYSVKARGIAKDIFGTEENYVRATQSLTKGDQLTSGFRWLTENERNIREHLSRVMPEYIKKSHSAVELLKELV